MFRTVSELLSKFGGSLFREGDEEKSEEPFFHAELGILWRG